MSEAEGPVRKGSVGIPGGIPGQAWFDAYSVKAHWAPVLAVSGPPLITALAAMPSLVSAKAAMAGALLVCLPPALGFMARNCGKRLEPNLWACCDGKPTIRFLRHRDGTIPEPTKVRYFEFLAAAGIRRPTPAEETRDPAAADTVYASVGDWLRRHTRRTGCNPHADRQNAAYGFARNLLGVRPYGLPVALVSAMLAALGLALGGGGDPAFLAAALAINLAMVAVWWRHVTPEAVRLADTAYAIAILEGCEPQMPPHRQSEPGSSRPGTG